MAQAAVSIALHTVHDLLVDEVKFLYGVRGRVEEVRTELLMMRSFLIDADAKQDVDERILNWVAQVREAVYDVEDCILQYVAVGRGSRQRRDSKNFIWRFNCFLKDLVRTHRLGNEVSAIRNKLSGLTRSLQTYGVRAATDGERSSFGYGSRYGKKLELRRTYSHVLEDDFVGMEDDIKLLLEDLMKEHKDHIIAICGMGGSGKTTIARKLYYLKDVRRRFDSFAWTCISQQWDKKDILQGILIKLIPEDRDRVIGMREDELIRQIHDVQLPKKCLVVLDDIWSVQDWESLKPAFPIGRRTRSKIVLTTRHRDVAMHVKSSGGLVYEPRSLNEKESWELLRKKAFQRNYGEEDSEPEVDQELEKLGRLMVRRCSGLPLAIVVLGGLLISKSTLGEWEMIHQNINWSLAVGATAVTEVLAFSYHDLPHKFKQCFQYLANFPEDFQVPAEKLYQLWLAEGLISQEDRAEEETMMDVAERYLGELAQRCLVQVEVKETAGCFKSCHLHDLMRDLCLSKAKEENFTQVIDYRDGKKPMDLYSSCSSIRRVTIYLDSDASLFFPPASSDNSRIRSLFLYSNGCKEEVWLQIRSHLSDFRLLRVLDLQGFRCAEKVPEAIGELMHLRYLSIRRSQFKNLPSSIEKLRQLQTLDLEVYDVSLQIPNVIWKMESLRHLYLPATFHTKDNKALGLDRLIALETLINFNTSLCDVNDLHGLTRLRKLRAVIKEKLEDLASIMSYLSSRNNQLRRFSLSIRCQEFSSDEEFSFVTQILGCNHLYKLFIQGRMGKLSDHNHFSQSIAKLSFKASQLKEDPMKTLEKLPKLSSLTFYDSTFVGREIICSANGFPQLKYLKLWGLQELESWEVSEGTMPKLIRLVLAHCDELKMLPDGLQYLQSLQKLNARRMPNTFRNRLREIDGKEGEDFHKVQHVPDIKID